MRYLPSLIATVAAFSLAACAQAASRAVTPASFAAAAKAAQPGDTLELGPGDYGDIVLPPADHARPVTIDARRARVSTVTIRKTAGWTWRGGVVASPLPPAAFRSMLIQDAGRIEVAGVNFRGGLNAATIITSQDVTLRDNTVTGVHSDGVNVAASQRVRILDNTMSDFASTEAVWKDGKLIKDAPHADGIQLWSLPNLPPTADILIAGNKITGKTQGITHFWHAHQGRPKVERVTVERNEVAVESWWGIGMLDAPGVVVRDNVVKTLPNAKRMKARLLIDASGEHCGNRIDQTRPDRACTKP